MQCSQKSLNNEQAKENIFKKIIALFILRKLFKFSEELLLTKETEVMSPKCSKSYHKCSIKEDESSRDPEETENLIQYLSQNTRY